GGVGGGGGGVAVGGGGGEAWGRKDGLGILPRRAAAFLYHHAQWERPLLRAADRIIAVSDEIARSLRRWFGVSHERIEVVYNGVDTDRKSTRLNSSHGSISYAVFCLK